LTSNVNNQIEGKIIGILSSIRDQKTKKQGNKRTAKNGETREVIYSC